MAYISVESIAVIETAHIDESGDYGSEAYEALLVLVLHPLAMEEENLEENYLQ